MDKSDDDGPVRKKIKLLVYVSLKNKDKWKASFWLSLQYPYLRPNSKLRLRIKYILVGGDGLYSFGGVVVVSL